MNSDPTLPPQRGGVRTTKYCLEQRKSSFGGFRGSERKRENLMVEDLTK